MMGSRHIPYLLVSNKMDGWNLLTGFVGERHMECVIDRENNLHGTHTSIVHMKNKWMRHTHPLSIP